MANMLLIHNNRYKHHCDCQVSRDGKCQVLNIFRRRRGGIRNLAVTKKLINEFCLFFTDMT